MSAPTHRSASLCRAGRSRRGIVVFVALLALCVAAEGTPSQDQNAPTIVLIVRHAEKASVEGNDPPLSDAGRKRAEELARATESAGVSAIYTTQFKRAVETAMPLAARTGATVRPVEITGENAQGYAARLAKRVLSEHAGRTVVVVGHSNTVPLLVEAFGGERPPAIDDATEFDRFFVVIVSKSGAPKTIKARY